MTNAKMVVTKGKAQLNGEMTQNRLLTQFDRAHGREVKYRDRWFGKGWKCDSKPKGNKRRGK